MFYAVFTCFSCKGEGFLLKKIPTFQVLTQPSTWGSGGPEVQVVI